MFYIFNFYAHLIIIYSLIDLLICNTKLLSIDLYMQNYLEYELLDKPIKYGDAPIIKYRDKMQSILLFIICFIICYLPLYLLRRLFDFSNTTMMIIILLSGYILINTKLWILIYFTVIQFF